MRKSERAAYEKLVVACMAETDPRKLAKKMGKPVWLILKTLKSAAFAVVRREYEELARVHGAMMAERQGSLAVAKLGALMKSATGMTQLQACVKSLELTGKLGPRAKTKNDQQAETAAEAALAADARETLKLLQASEGEELFGQYQLNGPVVEPSATPEEGDKRG